LSEEQLEVELKRLLGEEKEPYPHQIKTAQALLEGKSVILHAPTGSGKSEAVIFPFLLGREKQLPPQLIYSLPLRSLVESLGERFREYEKAVAIQHGQKRESVLFGKPVVVTTIDQTVGAYACTPLSAPLRHGNIPAGAISSALLAFDEVHLLDPDLGFQSALLIASHSHRFGLPFVLLSATLPKRLREELAEEFDNLVVVDCNEDDIPVRRTREVNIAWKNSPLTAEDIRQKYNAKSQKLIVVCNTVDRAQNLYEELMKDKPCEVLLVHSRFLPRHRAEKEERLRKELFGKDANEEPAILIATQVIEAGLDISAPLLLTDLAPVDSLIQRAGRCARWGNQGEVLVFEVPHPAPYSKDLIETTRKLLQERSGARLDWETEKEWVNEILNEEAERYLNQTARAAVLSKLSEAAFKRDRSLAASAVREQNLSCKISIHDLEELSADEARLLERIRIPLSILRKAMKEHNVQPFELVDENIFDDESVSWKLSPIQDPDRIRPGGFYILSPSQASYEEGVGLRLGIPGRYTFEFQEKKKKEEPKYKYRKETWVEHAQSTLKAFQDHLQPHYQGVINRYAEAWGIDLEEFLKMIEVMLLLHDLGKLNVYWQKKIGWDGKVPLAHSDSGEKKRRPPHATVSAAALSKLFFDWSQQFMGGTKLGKAFYWAVGHHHSVKAHRFGNYNLIEAWKDAVSAANLAGIVEIIIPQAHGNDILRGPELVGQPMTYRTYALLSRLLRESDWIATKGEEDALLCFEERYRTL